MPFSSHYIFVDILWNSSHPSVLTLLTGDSGITQRWHSKKELKYITCSNGTAKNVPVDSIYLPFLCMEISKHWPLSIVSTEQLLFLVQICFGLFCLFFIFFCFIFLVCFFGFVIFYKILLNVISSWNRNFQEI